MWKRPLRALPYAAAALVALVVAAAQTSRAGQQEAFLPNIVVIIGDDHGWPYSGFMGSSIVETPHLDRLVDEGTVFTHGYSSASVCQPALQTLLTGLSPLAWDRRRAELEAELGLVIPDREEVVFYDTLPRQLATQGYLSFQGGKHWEGTFAMAGFDEGTTTSISFPPFAALDFGRPSIEEVWSFVDALASGPFLLWLAPMLPHNPFDAPQSFQDPYLGLGLDPSAVLYYANVTRFDAVVGEIVAGLEARGLRQDTLIIYLSDNGWEQGPYENYWLGRWVGGPKGKLSAYELGFRTPVIFSLPGFIEAGVVHEDLVLFEDVHATCLDYAGVPLPASHAGSSLRDRLEGRAADPARDRIYGLMEGLRFSQEALRIGSFRSDQAAAFVRTEEWRYIRNLDTDAEELYWITGDPFEEIELSGEEPAITDQLSRDLDAWLATTVPEPTGILLAVSALLTVAAYRQATGRSLQATRTTTE